MASFTILRWTLNGPITSENSFLAIVCFETISMHYNIKNAGRKLWKMSGENLEK